MQLKLIITGLFCMVCSSVLHADYDAADLQKLFTDKKQRARINAARSGVDNSPEIQKKTKKIKISGYVRRSDGKNVVWINNKNTLQGSIIDDVKVYQSSIGNNKEVTISVDGKTRQLKPGETWNKETGKIIDSQ